MGDVGSGDERQPESGVSGETSEAESSSTVGTGSVLGIGCLVVVVLLILIAVAFRWFGGSW